jgi:hypothetical protein
MRLVPSMGVNSLIRFMISFISVMGAFLQGRLSFYKKSMCGRAFFVLIVALVFYFSLNLPVWFCVMSAIYFEISSLNLIFNHDFYPVRLYLENHLEEKFIESFCTSISFILYFSLWIWFFWYFWYLL